MFDGNNFYDFETDMYTSINAEKSHAGKDGFTLELQFDPTTREMWNKIRFPSGIVWI